jgi:hypothetical protein
MKSRKLSSLFVVVVASWAVRMIEITESVRGRAAICTMNPSNRHTISSTVMILVESIICARWDQCHGDDYEAELIISLELEELPQLWKVCSCPTPLLCSPYREESSRHIEGSLLEQRERAFPQGSSYGACCSPLPFRCDPPMHKHVTENRLLVIAVKDEN